MAKKKQKPIITTDSDVMPQQPGSYTTDPDEMSDISKAGDGGDEIVVAEEDRLVSSEGRHPVSSAETGADLLDDLRRSLQEDDIQQDGYQSRKWWSRGGNSTWSGSTADLESPGASNENMPFEGSSFQRGETREDDLRQGGNQSGKWWSQGRKSIRYDGEPDIQAPTSSDEEDPVYGDLNQMNEPQVEKGEMGKTDGKYVLMEDYSLNRSQAEYPPRDGSDETHISSNELDELKRKAFQPRVVGEGEEETTDMRSIVLDGDDNVFIEVQPQSSNAFAKWFTAVENRLRPYKSYIFAGLALLILIMMVVAGLLAFNVYQRLRAPAPEKEAVVLPYPVTLSLPGGLRFELGKGQLEEGEWSPRGPEWLEGTELCRWVAIPWSPQLEAVIQTLKPNDPIDLEMSNNDRVAYKVDSISQLSMEEMQALDSNSPCLVLVLSGSELKTRWVVIASP